MEQHKFMVGVLLQNKDTFNNFFIKYHKIGLGYVKTESLYKFLLNNPSFDNFNTKKIPSIGNVLKSKILSFDLNEAKSPDIVINFEDIILSILSKHMNKELTLSQIYKEISSSVGGSHINITNLQPYKNRDNTLLEKSEAKKRQEGFIRSFLEERSADSRQHYVKCNKLNRGGVNCNLFSNESLGQRNQIIHWKIASPENNQILKDSGIRKSGLWKICPSLNKPSEEEFIVMENELANRNKCFRNHQNISPKEYVVLTRSFKSFF
jgi:hypothetical protein